jgi:hypothetical protein
VLASAADDETICQCTLSFSRYERLEMGMLTERNPARPCYPGALTKLGPSAGGGSSMAATSSSRSASTTLSR